MFAFSSEDPSLALPFSGRDLLGTQVIWQRRARDLVPALTGASRQPEGFQVLLTALAWWPNFAERYRRPQKDLHNFFLLVEQALARACKMKGHDWPLPGSRRLNDAQTPGLWIGLEARRDFLVNSPLSNGTWGIYRRPAVNAGLIDETDRLSNTLSRQVRETTGVIESLFAQIARSLQAHTEQVLIAQKCSQRVVQLARIVESPPQRVRIREAFVRPESQPLTCLLAKLASEDGQEPIAHLVSRARKKLPGFNETLRSVQSCERYITCLDMAFEWLARHPGHRLEKLAAELPVNMDALRTAQARFKISGAYEGLAWDRQQMLAGAAVGSSHSLIVFLVSHHEAISTDRSTTPLVSWSDTKRLDSVLALEPHGEERIDAQRIWRNNYYLDALRHLAMRTGGNGK